MMYVHETIIRLPGEKWVARDVTHKTMASAQAQIDAIKKIHGDKGTYIILSSPVRGDVTKNAVNTKKT